MKLWKFKAFEKLNNIAKNQVETVFTILSKLR